MITLLDTHSTAHSTAQDYDYEYDYEYEIEHLERTVEALTHEICKYRTERAVDLLLSVCDVLNADTHGEFLEFLNPELIELSKKLESCKNQQTED